MESKLVSNRECGECTVCCVTLRIEEEDLNKLADTPCPNLTVKKGCSIYENRPNICRGWYCAWRFMAQLGNEWRPDRSGIVLRLNDSGIIFQPIKDPYNVLTSQLAIELIGGGIENGVSIFISVPTKEGYCYSLLKLNEKLKSVVATRDGYKTQRAMLDMVKFASSQQTDPILPLNI